MAKECIKEAATVEEAVAAACEELGVDAAAVQVEVLAEPQKKVLGLFGGTQARVRVCVPEVETTDGAEAMCAYLKDILKAMGADVTVTAEKKEDGYVLKLEGDDVGFIIGHRGETLDALQYLVSLIANRADRAYCRVTIEVGDYREKREQSLTELARRRAEQAAKTGRRISLEPMNPYERRIIHTAVQDVEGATSWSVGSGERRHVIIGPTDDNPNKDKGNNRSRGGRGGRGGRREGGNRGERRDSGRSSRPTVAADRPVRAFVSRSNPLPTADGATVSEDRRTAAEKTDTLYSRIDL